MNVSPLSVQFKRPPIGEACAMNKASFLSISLYLIDNDLSDGVVFVNVDQFEKGLLVNFSMHFDRCGDKWTAFVNLCQQSVQIISNPKSNPNFKVRLPHQRRELLFNFDWQRKCLDVCYFWRVGRFSGLKHAFADERGKGQGMNGILSKLVESILLIWFAWSESIRLLLNTV